VDRVIAVTVDSPRSLPAAELASLLVTMGFQAETAESRDEAYSQLHASACMIWVGDRLLLSGGRLPHVERRAGIT